MTLEMHLAENGVSQSAFAARVGVSRMSISRLCRGKQTPSLALARRIERATDGAVSVSSWVRASDEEAAGAGGRGSIGRGGR